MRTNVADDDTQLMKWSKRLERTQKELTESEKRLAYDKGAVRRGEEAVATLKAQVDGCRVELMIAAGVIPDRARPDDSSAVTAEELAMAIELMENSERIVDDPKPEPTEKSF